MLVACASKLAYASKLACASKQAHASKQAKQAYKNLSLSLSIYIYIYEVCQKLLLPDVIFIIDLPEGLPETFRNLPECRF